MTNFELKLCFILLLINYLNCFNFDTKLLLYKKILSNQNNNNNNYFGYSLAQHYVNRIKTNYILVGAPKEILKNYGTSGAIYKCPVTFEENDCSLVDVQFNAISKDELDKNGKKLDEIAQQFQGQIYDNQWLGVSISSTGSGAFSACAHRYSHNYSFVNFDEIAMFGACYSFNNDLIQENKHIPCLKYTYGINQWKFNYAYCNTGTSLDLESVKSNTFMTMGMPSALNFRGVSNTREWNQQGLSTNYLPSFDSQPCSLLYNDDVEENKVCENLWPSNSYLGYATVFITNQKESYHVVASSAPRENLNGSVRFFRLRDSGSGGDNMFVMGPLITGPTQGSYFGHSMSAVDVDGDGFKDLIVGAPYYMEKFEINKGAVYVYRQNASYVFSSTIAFSYYGKKNSKFGSAISLIGDIDNDGIEDFAVGAPYEENVNSLSTGAVYIFRGAKNPSDIKLSQILYAKDFVNDKNDVIKRFGSSLSGGLDMDSNSYPDLLIGAFPSNLVFVVRTYPIINLEATISNIEKLQDIDQLKCSQNKSIECFQLNLCFKIINNSRNKGILNLTLPKVNYTLIGDSKLSYSRISFTSTNKERYDQSIDINNLVDSKESACEKINVNLKDFGTDYLTPITFNIEFDFDFNKDNIENSYKLTDINKYPVLNKDLRSNQFEVKFKRDCGVDFNCTTDIRLSAKLENLTIDKENEHYLISYKEIDEILLHVKVDNKREVSEPSYGTIVNIKFDERLDFKKIEKADAAFINYHSNSTHLICSITSGPGLPFRANETTEFTIKFGTFNLTRNTVNKFVKINVELRSLSNDITLSDNIVDLNAKLVVKANFQFYEKNTPEQVFYSDKIRGESAMKSLDNIGPTVEHMYIIDNLGPFSMNYFRMKFYWPFELSAAMKDSKDQRGKRLLYLTDKPSKIPNNHPINMICENYVPLVDPLNIRGNSRVYKRSDDELKTEAVRKSQEAPIIDCFSNTARCHLITCEFYGELVKGDRIQIKFIARLWNSTLAEDYSKSNKVIIKSYGELILNDTVSDEKDRFNASAQTIAYSEITPNVIKSYSIWIYIGSALGGVFLLCVCIFAFWMMGFFERKKYEGFVEESEKLRKIGDQ